MAINIIGAGPTGITIAWELCRQGHEVHIWDKHDTCGGSWWEPEGSRDFHAPRVLFKRAFANFRSLLLEMGLKWDDYFVKSDALEKSFFASIKYFSFLDYFKLLKLFIKTKSDPTWAKSTPMYDELEDTLSDDGEKLLSVMPIAIDGVSWERMTVWEFVDSIDTTLFSTAYTQGTSGRLMCEDMECVLRSRGVQFHFNQELVDVEYKKDGYTALFKTGKTIGDGKLILAVDPGPAKKLIKNNWGDIQPILDEICYGCVNVLLWFDEKPDIETDIAVLAENEGKILPLWEGDILSCTIYRPIGIPENQLVQWIVKTLNIPQPNDFKICWGSKWNGNIWEHEQTSGIHTSTPIPVTGNCPHVHMVGMMSPRTIPFASIESAVEVGRIFVSDYFDGRGPKYNATGSTLILIIFVIFLFISIYR